MKKFISLTLVILLCIFGYYVLVTEWILDPEKRYSYTIYETVPSLTNHTPVVIFPQFEAPPEYYSTIPLDQKMYDKVEDYAFAYYAMETVDLVDTRIRLTMKKFEYRKDPGFYQCYTLIKEIAPDNPPVKLSIFRAYGAKVNSVLENQVEVKFTAEFNTAWTLIILIIYVIASILLCCFVWDITD